MLKLGWKLVSQLTGKEVNIGDEFLDSRGDTMRLTGGFPPRHSGSTGRVEVKQVSGEFASMGAVEYFPSVIKAVWVKESEEYVPPEDNPALAARVMGYALPPVEAGQEAK
jgi:hypothetical protein